MSLAGKQISNKKNTLICRLQKNAINPPKIKNEPDAFANTP